MKRSGFLGVMKPVKFEGQTATLGAPVGVSHSACGGLPVAQSNGAFHSCWELTEDEWLDIRNNGFRLWLTLHAPGHPMVTLSVDQPFAAVKPSHKVCDLCGWKMQAIKAMGCDDVYICHNCESVKK